LSEAAPLVAGDAQALAWFDQLLDAAQPERPGLFDRLTDEPEALQARVWRMWRASQATGSSLALGEPVGASIQAARDAATANLASGDVVAGYRLLRELGRGGTSVVWLGVRADGGVKREVAIKMPLFVLASPTATERFARERDVLARLTHPQIARLYDAGIASGGQPFIVMEFVDGVPMTQACDLRCLSIEQRLRLFLQLLAAVEHAHRHLVVHRDIKPSNILVDAQGQARLLDFGIAKLLADGSAHASATQLTLEGGNALTPHYAAPEQFNNRPISTATDIYSLGVVLYELLTGTRPHARNPTSIAQSVHAVLNVEPVRPSQARLDASSARARGTPSVARLRAALAGDLDTIVLKALRKTPTERYGSADRLADDLRRFLRREPISARPASWVYAARLFIQRHRPASLATALGLAAAVGLVAVAWQQHLQTGAQQARGDAVRNFMFDLVDDAEADESNPGAQITGKQMVDGAVLRARQSFADRPQLQGELLSELGRMYTRLGERDKALGPLSEALALLQMHAPAADPALNKTRAYLAEVLLADNQIEPARSLAATAREACTGSDRDSAKARAYAGSIMSQVALREGHPGAALIAMRRVVNDTAAGFGDDHPETAMALHSLAVTARNAGDLPEAGHAIDRALTLAQGKTLRAADRTQLSRSKAMLDLDLGRFASARAQLTELLSRQPSREERALQLRLLAHAELALGNPSAARDACDTAIALADATAPADPELLFARQAHARAQSQLGLTAQALGEFHAVIDGLLTAGYALNSFEVLRARRFHAEAQMHAGDLNSAGSELESIASEHARVTEQAENKSDVEWGQTLDLLGRVKRETRDTEEALALHMRAHSLLEKKLPAAHPLLVLNALYREAAEAAAQPMSASTTPFNAQTLP